MNRLNPYLLQSAEVEAAINANRPVVALESTIISHGMSYPRNVETALEVERAVRNLGVIPATIAILDGQLRAGLSPDEIERLGLEGAMVRKCSRRDIPTILANGVSGATTVATTMIIAEMAGIEILATGGIGGVHRNASHTFDISADLQELSRTSVAVVCAGAKSILDLPLTLEYLETHGVPVWGYQTDEFPAFFSRKSGLKLEDQMDEPFEIAQALITKWAIPSLRGGVVVANPIPLDFEMEYAYIQELIEQALQESEEIGIRGKNITPFLLSRIEELSEGASLEANIQLVLNNARLAAKIAQDYYSSSE